MKEISMKRNIMMRNLKKELDILNKGELYNKEKEQELKQTIKNIKEQELQKRKQKKKLNY